MTEDLAKRKRIRAGHKASATRMLNEVDTLMAEPSPELSKLSQLRMSIEEKLKTLKLLDDNIIDLIEDEDEIAEEIEGADFYKEGIYGALVKIDRATLTRPKTPPAPAVGRASSAATTPKTPPALILPVEISPVATTSFDTAATSSDVATKPPVATKSPVATTTPISSAPPSLPPFPLSTTSSSVFRTTSSVKLPKLSLPPFNGEITAWTAFWDSYESAIHSNLALSDIDKFNYLRSLLEKNAYDAIAGLSLTAVNYNEAIAILRKRFGNKQQIITKHMDNLLCAEAVTSANNMKSIRKLYDLVESNIRSLKSLNVPPESYGSLLSSVLLKKMPQEIQLIVSRNVTGTDWSNLDVLLKIVEEEIEARERMTANVAKQVKKFSNDKSRLSAELEQTVFQLS